MNKKLLYVSQLPIEEQSAIEKELKALKLSEEDIERAMSSKLVDLEDTININRYV